jgi:hypothetical protein
MLRNTWILDTKRFNNIAMVSNRIPFEIQDQKDPVEPQYPIGVAEEINYLFKYFLYQKYFKVR